MKKAIARIVFILSFVVYAFLIFASFCMAEKLDGFVNALFLWIIVVWQAGILPVCLMYQVMYITRKSKQAMIIIAIIIMSLFITTRILL